MSDAKRGKMVHQPDDVLFKKMMERPESARAYLKQFHPALAPILNLESLKLESGHFVSDDLGNYFSDIVEFM